MAHTLIKQDNGKYSIWSTIIDNFIATDLTIKELNKYYRERAISKSMEEVANMLNKCGTYKHTPNTIEEALKEIKELHGDNK